MSGKGRGINVRQERFMRFSVNPFPICQFHEIDCKYALDNNKVRKLNRFLENTSHKLHMGLKASDTTMSTDLCQTTSSTNSLEVKYI
jgi:hypothetical protein